ncbi:MAG: hypothetical protein IT158_10840 [Bryobacterales bacterium]|nr:hypothetical protein [Bryobacterales bacterium]
MKCWWTAAVCAAAVISLLAPAGSFAQNRKQKEEEEEITQTREIPKDPPSAVVADTRRLVFHTSPLSAKGLLSQQVRDALKALNRRVRGASIVKLRAFVAGSGDTRRVQAIVSETFTERRVALPALTVVHVGGLPMEGAQVVIEAVSVARKETNEHGLAFISGQLRAEDAPLRPLAPLAEKSSADLDTALRAAGSTPADMLRVTCFLSALDGLPAIRQHMESRFPNAAFNYVQTQRAVTRSLVECEGVARLAARPREALAFLNPDGLPKSAFYSQVALIGAPRVALSGLQMAFGFQDDDARLAFQRLVKALEQVKVSIKDVAMSNIYPLHPQIGEQARKIRTEFYDRSRPPGSTMLSFEGLPSMDAGFGVDVVAVVRD